MYNTDLKNRFINDITTSPEIIEDYIGIFNKLESYETKLGKDICTMPKDVVSPILNDIAGTRATTRYYRILKLKAYCKWCLNNHVPDASDAILKCSVDLANKEEFAARTVSSPKEFNDYLDLVYDPISDCSIQNMYRCLLWLVYMGVKTEDLPSIKESDIDLLHSTFKYKGIDIKIYPEAYPVFSILLGCPQYKHRHPKYTVVSWRPKCDGDELLRGIRQVLNTDLKKDIVKDLKKKANDGVTQKWLTYPYIRLSGLCYAQYSLEKSGIPPTFENSLLLEEPFKSGSDNLRGAFWMFKKEYDAWKLTYDL